MTSLPGLHREENGEEEVAGGNATQQHAIACNSPRYPHTGNNKWLYLYLCDFLFPSGRSIWLMFSINILLKCNKANESFNCCGTGWELYKRRRKMLRALRDFRRFLCVLNTMNPTEQVKQGRIQISDLLILIFVWCTLIQGYWLVSSRQVSDITRYEKHHFLPFAHPSIQTDDIEWRDTKASITTAQTCFYPRWHTSSMKHTEQYEQVSGWPFWTSSRTKWPPVCLLWGHGL